MPTEPERTAQTAAQKRLAAQRAAAARERIQSAQRRRRLMIVLTAVGTVVVVLAALLIVKAVVGGKSPKSGDAAALAGPAVTRNVSSVPAAVFDAVGKGESSGAPTAVSGGSALRSGGKPEVLYIGAEFCPYCAGERWALAVAMSRFGTFHDLGAVRSSSTDEDPNTATLSFHGATYTSKYLSFVGKEIQSNKVVNGNYAPLDTLDAQEKALFSKVTGYPYLNLGGRYTLNQVQYDPGVLQGKDQRQISAALSDESSPIARSVVGSANRLTVDLCTLTGDKPASVCASSGVRAAT